MTIAERSLRENELVGDIMAKWEKTSHGTSKFQIVFKKRLFFVPTEETRDLVAQDLIFHQVLLALLSSLLSLLADCCSRCR